MLPLIQAYCLDVDTIEMETVLAKRALKDKDITSISDVIHEVYQLKAAFASLLKLLQITQTIAVSTAECERSFSALKRIKTYLRSTMSNDRLSNLVPFLPYQSHNPSYATGGPYITGVTNLLLLSYLIVVIIV